MSGKAQKTKTNEKAMTRLYALRKLIILAVFVL